MRLFLSIIIIVLSTFFNACTKQTSVETTTFKVWGNCVKCQKIIESSAKLDGVVSASWNIDSKLMNVSFDTLKVSLSDIQKNIAKAGYDNDAYYGNDYAYAKLEECCQYERRPYEMN